LLERCPAYAASQVLQGSWDHEFGIFLPSLSSSRITYCRILYWRLALSGCRCRVSTSHNDADQSPTVNGCTSNCLVAPLWHPGASRTWTNNNTQDTQFASAAWGQWTYGGNRAGFGFSILRLPILPRNDTTYIRRIVDCPSWLSSRLPHTQ